MNLVPEHGYLSRASLLIQSRRYEEATQVLMECVVQNPQCAHAHALMSMCFRETDKLKEATEQATLAIAAEPELAIGHYAMANAMWARNRFETANISIDEAIRLESDDPENFALKSQILFSLRDWRGSLAAAEKGLELSPTDETCANLHAMALRQLRQGSVAEDSIRATLARDPDNAITHANLGWSLLDDGKPNEALVHFQEALRLEPDSAFARQGLIHALRARYFFYRWMFAYFSWISKFSAKYMWGILIGGYVGYQLLAGFAKRTPSLAPFIYPLMAAYVVFALSTWLITPLTNFLLLSSRYGRFALQRLETMTAVAVVTSLVLGILTVIAFFAAGNNVSIHILVLGIAVGLLSIPIAGAAHCDRGWPRNTAYTIVGVLTVMVVLMATSVISGLRDGSGLNPERTVSIDDFSISGIEYAKLDAAQREAAKQELKARYAEHRQRFREWDKSMTKHWVMKLFGTYSTCLLISQFVIMGLQSTRVRL